jgi:hypothetical protein
LIAAQSGGIPNSLSAPLAEAENPSTPPPGGITYPEDPAQDIARSGGCNIAGINDQTLNMSGRYSQLEGKNKSIFPCEEYASNTILDEITNVEGIPTYYDWQYIAASEGSIWSAPIGVNHLYTAYNNAVANGTTATQPFAVDVNAANFAANLYGPGPTPRPIANLTYITPCLQNSDHPGTSGVENGPAWVGWLVNAIGESAYWKTTTILITWDDWGGWFDHMPANPPQFPYPNAYSIAYGPNAVPDSNEWGFRVPLIAISPYGVGAAYVSQPTSPNGVPYRSQAAIMQYVEATFNLPSLNGDDFYQNLNSKGEPTDFLKDMFNYNLATPRPFVPVTGVGSTPPPCQQ